MVNWSRIRTKPRASRYRTTENYIYRLYATQEGQCAICREVLGESFVVDHSHATGAVRGLLCQPCNKGLGFFRDSPETMSRAIRYISGPATGMDE